MNYKLLSDTCLFGLWTNLVSKFLLSCLRHLKGLLILLGYHALYFSHQTSMQIDEARIAAHSIGPTLRCHVIGLYVFSLVGLQSLTHHRA